MTRKKVVLHIGIEKTGTTSIQDFFRLNQKKLLKNGVVVEPGLLNNFNNMEYVIASESEPGHDLATFRKQSFESFRDDLKTKILAQYDEHRLVDTLLLSSEHFSSRMSSLNSIRQLKKIFPLNTDFSVLVYLKRQDELYIGEMAEGMKAGIPFDKIVKPAAVIARKRYGSQYYNYFNLLEMWGKVFGKENILVRVFDSKKLVGNNVVQDFCQSLKIFFQELQFSSEYSNPVFSPEILICLDYLYQHYSEIPRHKLQFILSKNTDFEKGTLVSGNELYDFLHQFAESNRAVAEMYIGTKDLFDMQLNEMRFFDGMDAGQIAKVKSILIAFIDQYTAI